MKILFINDFLEGGGAEGVFRLSYEIFKEQGHEVEIFYGAEQHQTPENICQYFYNKEFKTQLVKLLDKFKPDIIHIHNYYHLLTSAIFSAIKVYKKSNGNCKVVMTAHDFHLICPSSHLLYYKKGLTKTIKIPLRWYYWFFKRIDNRGIHYSLIKKMVWLYECCFQKPIHDIDLIISPSNFLSAVYRESGIKNRIECIRNPLNTVNHVLYKSISKSSRLKFVYFGRLSSEKGLSVFFDYAFNLNLELEIDIYGIGPEEVVLKKILNNNDLIRVNFLGVINNTELQKKLVGYDVAIIPSTGYENAPLSIVEAANAGLVIWGTDNGGTKEICEEIGVPCFLYKPYNIKDYQESYEMLLDYFKTETGFEINLKSFDFNSFYKGTNKFYLCL